LEYCNNILCIEAGWLISEGIVTKSNYDNLLSRGWIKRERRPSKHKPALISYDSIPQQFKNKIIEKIGDPYKVSQESNLKEHIKPDMEAMEYFTTYQLDDGRFLPEESTKEYHNNVIILNAVHAIITKRIAKRRNLGGNTTEMWEHLIKSIAEIKGHGVEQINHTLPTNIRRFKDRYNLYLKEGYASIIHKGFHNNNSRKVNDDIVQVLMSISAMPNRHFNTTVAEYYNQFVNGQIDLFNENTGELYDANKFKDKNGNPIEISEATVWNVLNNLKNKQELQKVRKSAIDFKTRSMPHNHRHRPQYSLSKISMDDRDLPRKAKDGTWISAYYAYDVMSECFIGWTHGKEKNTEMVYDCFRNMYLNLSSNDLPWPAEVEVENHLMKQISDKLHAMFGFVRFCNPQNSREKRAEHAIKSKKYTDEKKYQPNIGRWHSKHDAYQTNQDYTQNLTTAQLIADDIESIRRYNNAPHSIHKDKSRWQVLLENLNPELIKPQERILFRHIGNRTQTSVRNNDFVRVQYADYAIDTMNIMARMKPNNYTVDAYWLPDTNETIRKVYLYQDDNFLCSATKYETYNEAQAERTEKDEMIRIEQAKRQTSARKSVKDGLAKKVVPIGILPKTDYSSVEANAIETIPNNNARTGFEVDGDDDYYTQRALNDF